MSDKLEEIKAKNPYNSGINYTVLTQAEIDWLISEIERLRAELSKCTWHSAIEEAGRDAEIFCRERDEATRIMR